ncbi:MAG: squalene/phytoene synthase family protein [Pseudomonadota bacterium]
MTSPASDSLQEIQIRLDQRIRSVDEPRWLSSRYAPMAQRQTLITLYAFYYELARVRVAVSDPTLGQIRFQWWRDALDELSRGDVRQHDVVMAIAYEVEQNRLALADLTAFIDPFETAFAQNDRGFDPDGQLVGLASKVLSPETGLRSEIAEIARVWSALRRGEFDGATIKKQKVPSAVRPATAHLRLRRAWARKKSLSAFQQRLSILLAMLTGQV